MTTCLDLPTQRSARTFAFFRREVTQIMGPNAWERYGDEFRDLSRLYSRGRWRPEDYDTFQLIMSSIIDDVFDQTRADEVGQGGAQ